MKSFIICTLQPKMRRWRRMRWVGHVAHMGDEKCIENVRKPEGKRSFVRHSCR